MTISEFINDIQRELIELSISEDEVDKSSITNIIFDEKINDQIDTKITTFNGYLNRDFIPKLTGNSVLINMNEFYTNSMTGMISNVNTYIIKGHPITDPDVSAIGLTIFNNYYGLDSRRYSKTIIKGLSSISLTIIGGSMLEIIRI